MLRGKSNTATRWRRLFVTGALGTALSAAVVAGTAAPASAADEGLYGISNNQNYVLFQSYAWYRDLPPGWHDNANYFWNSTDVSMCIGNWSGRRLERLAAFAPGTNGWIPRGKEADAVVDCRYFLA